MIDLPSGKEIVGFLLVIFVLGMLAGATCEHYRGAYDIEVEINREG